MPCAAPSRCSDRIAGVTSQPPPNRIGLNHRNRNVGADTRAIAASAADLDRRAAHGRADDADSGSGRGGARWAASHRRIRRAGRSCCDRRWRHGRPTSEQPRLTLQCSSDRDRAIQRDRNWAGRRSHRHAAVMLEGEVCGDADDNDCASDDDRPSPGDRFHVSTPYTFVVLREPEVPAPTILLAVAVLVIGSFICFSPDFPTAQVCKGSSTPFPVQLT